MTSSTNQAAQSARLQPLAGQHAVITGGGRGIGAACADRLAALGARITLIGRTQKHVDEQASLLKAAYGKPVTAFAADVTDEGAVTQVFIDTVKATGEVSILVNNAGRGDSMPFKRMDVKFLRAMLEVNLVSTFMCTKAVLPAMQEKNFGRIINIASTAGLLGYRYVSAYVAAKHAVVGMTRALALELSKTGITVNAVCPGYTETDMVKDSIRNIMEKTGKNEADTRAQLATGNPQGRLVQPEEVANVVGFLALPESQTMTGQAVPVAGGEVM